MKRKYHVEMTVNAVRDLHATEAHIALDKPRAAARWVRKMRRHVMGLEYLPFRYEVIPEDAELEYRHIILGNYRAIFRIDADRVFVVRIFHAARILDTTSLQ